jgi:hypothetical protein
MGQARRSSPGAAQPGRSRFIVMAGAALRTGNLPGDARRTA